MLVLTTVLTATLVGGFLLTPVGQEAWLESTTNNPLTGPVSDEQYQGMQRMAPFVGYFTLGAMLVALPLIALILSGILFVIFNAALGGDASFKQILSVVVHASVIGVLGQLFTVPLNYMRGTMSSSTNLSVLTQSMLDEASFAARLLGMIDIFLVWQIIVLAMGLAVLYRRRTQPVATTLLVLYGVIAVIVAFIRRGAAA